MAVETKEIPQLRATKVIADIFEAWMKGKRRVWLEGGTYSSKTWSVMQFLKMIAEEEDRPLHITVISETMPHLKQGAILDFRNIMGSDFVEKRWNKTDYIYRWPDTGSWMQFLSADQPSKAAGPRRDVLFANEVNHIARDTFRQADMRTHLFTIADWNPESEFWFHDEELTQAEEYEDRQLINTNDVFLRGLTYLDALEVMPVGKREEIEQWEKKDPNWWRVYGLGLVGKIALLVYPNFEQVDEMPDAPKFYGLDFGILSDPTVLTEHCIIGDNLYSRELFYEYDTEMTNNKIAMKMQLLKVNRNSPIYPDPNEPKSATELRQLGWKIGDTVKGKGSDDFGIKAVNNYYQHWTKDSLNCIKEQRNYRYIKRIVQGREEITDDTTHHWSHGMKSREYAVRSHNPQVAVRHSKRSNYW